MKKMKLVIVISHPIQYHAPLYTKIGDTATFDLHVIFHNDRGVRPYYEKFSETVISYDNDLLKGYSYEFLTQGEATNLRDKIRHRDLPHLEERIAASKPDAVYFHGYWHVAHMRAFGFVKKLGAKLFFRGENEDVIPRPKWKLALRELFLKSFLKKCDALLYIGRMNKEFYSRRGITDSRLFFVPYSADNQYFGLDVSTTERTIIRKRLAAELGFNNDSVIFINTCKHRIEKSPMDLVHAYIKARKELGTEGKTTLILAGDGPLNKEMREAVSNAAITDVLFTGFVAQSRMKELLLAVWRGDLILWILGEKYAHLQSELVLVLMGFAISGVTGFFWALNLARGWVGHIWLNIPLTLAAMTLALCLVDVSTVQGAAWLGIMIATANLGHAAFVCLHGFLRHKF